MIEALLSPIRNQNLWGLALPTIIDTTAIDRILAPQRGQQHHRNPSHAYGTSTAQPEPQFSHVSAKCVTEAGCHTTADNEDTGQGTSRAQACIASDGGSRELASRATVPG